MSQSSADTNVMFLCQVHSNAAHVSPVCFPSQTVREKERGSLNTLCEQREAKHLGMGFNQDGAEWSPIHAYPHMERITGKSSASTLTQTAEQGLY